MFSNYLKTAWRNIQRSKGYSALNIFGLATGMAVALIIGLWVYSEYSFDKFLPGYKNIYQVKRNFNSNGDTLTFNSTSLKLAEALRTQIPEIEYVAECNGFYDHALSFGDKKLYLRGAIIQEDFLKMFQYPLVAGNPNSALKDPYSIALTEAAAQALFGDKDPMNQSVRFDNSHNLKVTAVLKDVPANSSLQFKFIVPFSYLDQTDSNIKANRAGSFGGNGYSIYAKLKPGATVASVSAKIRNIEKTETNNTNAMNSTVILQSMERWHLYSDYENGKDSGGFIEYIRMFTLIGALVLIIACINFVNLTTARSEKRAREVGVRKAVGSERKDLIFQFLTESILITFIAFLIALLLAELAIPSFNALTGATIGIPFANAWFWAILLLGVLITAIAAGSRPAFYLSSFNPVQVLKSNRQFGKASTLPRKILVVIQFSCSIALIISTFIIYKQIQYAQNRPTGFDADRLMFTNINFDLSRNLGALKNDLLGQGLVENLTSATSAVTDLQWHSDVDQWPGKLAGETIEMGSLFVTDDYFKTVGIDFVEGRDFNGMNDTTSVILNQAAVKRMRLKQPLGQTITWFGTRLHIIAVVKDALMASPFASSEPTLFYPQASNSGVIMYRISKNLRTQDAIQKIGLVFNNYSPGFPFNYQFADANYAAKFKEELLVGKLSGFFASLAIFISCLGLFGLAAYVAEQRTKEIGIRKVLGASVSQVWLMLSKDFMALVLISCLIASPLALYFLQQWLQKYAYHIQIGPDVFIWAGLFAILITLITISFQSVKAAIAKPVKSLRSE